MQQLLQELKKKIVEKLQLKDRDPLPKTFLLRQDIPRDPAGKILKRVLRQEIQAV